MGLLGVTYAAAKASMEKLITVGILDPTYATVGNTRYYAARDLIARVERPLGDDDGGNDE
jgi:hypothetical protein